MPRSHLESGAHWPPDHLIRFLDGELAADEAIIVERHIAHCTACRATLTRFKQATADFGKEALAPPFASTRRRLAPGVPAFSAISTLPRHHALGSRAMAASVALSLVGALVYYLVLLPPPVSARGLVGAARVKQSALWRHFPSREIRRSLKVTKEIDGAATAEEHWESAIRTATAHEVLMTQSDTAKEVSAAVPSAPCRLFVPLSLDMLDCLLSVDTLSVSVRGRSGAGMPESEAEYEIAVSALSGGDSGPFRSSWTLRSGDGRLTDVVYRIGSATYRIEEEAFTFAPLAPEQILVSEGPSISRAVPHEAAVTEIELDTRRAAPRNRLSAFEAIVAFGLTPEDDLDIVDRRDGTVLVKGTLPDEARKATLMEIVAGVPGVEAAVITQAEAIAAALAPLDPVSEQAAIAEPAAQPNVVTESSRIAEDPPPAPVRSEGPLLEAELEARFGSDEEGRTLARRFSENLLAESQNLLFEARWLERLQAAFPESQRSAFSLADQLRFEAVLSAMRFQVRGRHARLRSLAAAMLCPQGCTESAAGSMRGEAPPHTWMDDLQTEISLLKTLLVDRAFAPAASAEEAIARWRTADATVIVALAESETAHDDRRAEAAKALPATHPASGQH